MADAIRERCNATMQKLTSLKVAVDERRLQYNEILSVGECRPKTAFMKTPQYIIQLYENLTIGTRDLRNVLEREISRSSSSEILPPSEKIQLRSLVADLERELRLVGGRLQLETFNRHTSSSEHNSEKLPQIVSGGGGNREPALEEVRLKDCDSSLPVISSALKSSSSSKPETLRAKRTRTMMLRMQKLRESSTTVFKSNQSYPYDSSFPKLDPPRQRRYKNWFNTPNTGSDYVTRTDDVNSLFTNNRRLEGANNKTSWI